MSPVLQQCVSRQQNRPTAIFIKQSKTDPFCKGINIFLGATNNDVCLIKGILPYLAVRGNQKGLLFVTLHAKTSLVHTSKIDTLGDHNS